MSYIDIIFIGIICVSGLMAYYNGMIKTLFSFFSTIIAVVIAYLFYPSLSNFIINNTKLLTNIQEKVGKALDLEGLAKGVVSKQDQISLINNLEAPNLIKELLLSNNNPEIYKLISVQGIVEYISNMISRIVINAMSFVILFLISIIFLTIMSYLLGFIAKLPVLKQLNNLAGLIIGVVWGILINWIICVAIYVLIGFKGDGELLVMINESVISKIFYNNNPLIELIIDVTKTLK